MSYNAQDIIGKTLIAAGPVTIYRAANDSAAPVYTVPVGQSVGVVYSYLLPGSGRAYCLSMRKPRIPTVIQPRCDWYG